MVGVRGRWWSILLNQVSPPGLLHQRPDNTYCPLSNGCCYSYQFSLIIYAPHRSSAYSVPVTYSWRLNERHYGNLVGRSKVEAEQEFGVEQLSRWRNGWDTAPPAMDERTMEDWKRSRHCMTVTQVKDPASTRLITMREGLNYINSSFSEPRDRRGGEPNIFDEANPTSTNWLNVMTARMPATESLKDSCIRVLPILRYGLAPRLLKGETVLLSAHANTIRSLLYHLDPRVTEDGMKGVKIPSAAPFITYFEGGGEDLIGGLRNVGDVDVETGLMGTGLQSEESAAHSFCTLVGESAGEGEIA
jgi:bisphosphoglycerate-dependent phosphoglycerate mutase